MSNEAKLVVEVDRGTLTVGVSIEPSPLGTPTVHYSPDRADEVAAGLRRAAETCRHLRETTG